MGTFVQPCRQACREQVPAAATDPEHPTYGTACTRVWACGWVGWGCGVSRPLGKGCEETVLVTPGSPCLLSAPASIWGWLEHAVSMRCLEPSTCEHQGKRSQEWVQTRNGCGETLPTSSRWAR